MKKYTWIEIETENGEIRKQKVEIKVNPNNDNRITMDDVKSSVKDGLAELKHDATRFAKLSGGAVIGYGYVYVKSVIAEMNAIVEVFDSLGDKAEEMYL